MPAAYPLDLAAVLERLRALAEALPAVQAAVLGIPDSWEVQLTAAVTLAGLTAFHAEDDVPGALQREARFLVQLGYSTDGDEGGAEVALAAAVDAFQRSAYGDEQLNYLLASLSVDAPQADQIEYQLFASQEVRLYPLVVRGRQWGAY